MASPFIVFDADDFTIEGYGTRPLVGYEVPKGFPLCCEYHRHVLKDGESFFERFPNCCDEHKKLATKPWFVKEKYSGLPTKIVNQLSFTEHHISSQLNKIDWFEDIEDYIEWNVGSFGHPPIGLHIYLTNLKLYIEVTTTDIPKDKRQRLMELVESFLTPKMIDKDQKVDLNELYDTYKKWLSIFPFEINYFNEIKEHFSKMLPIVKNIRVNRYSRIAKAQMITKRDLIENLLNTTRQLLKAVDSTDLFRKKLINDPQKQQIEIINETHRVEQNGLLEDLNKDESKYLALIKKWLDNERKYFKTITPLLQPIKETIMPKDFDIEIREIFEKPYLKVFIKEIPRLQEIALILKGLGSVKNVNITESRASGSQDKNLTVYPSRVFDINETKKEVDFTLTNLFQGNKADPIFEDEIISSISAKAYSDIIERILIFGKNLEKFQSLYDHFDEEKFRDYFLPYLNSISKKHSGTGETFNKRGKTDILIQDASGNNIFIAECKLWNGQAELKKAVDQLFERYVNWRDERVAIIIFNKDVKGFSEVISKAQDSLKEHANFESFIGHRKDSSYSFKFMHPEDSKKTILLELILFNCTQS